LEKIPLRGKRNVALWEKEVSFLDKATAPQAKQMHSQELSLDERQPLSLEKRLVF
jgi:hypothetical protein